LVFLFPLFSFVITKQSKQLTAHFTAKIRHTLNFMISTRYYLHSKVSKKGTQSLYMDVHCDGAIRLRQAIGETLRPGEWNPKKEIVNNKHEYSDTINARLERLNLKVQQTFREMMDEGQRPTGEDLRKLLRPLREEKMQQAGPPPIRQTYLDWKLSYLQRKNRGVVVELDTKAERSLQGYNYARIFKQVVAALEGFKPDATYKDLTALNWEKYLDYLQADLGVDDTTISTHVKGWKALRGHVGLSINEPWLKNTYNKAKLLPDLSWQELNQLADFTYESKILEEAAHAFVMDCQLALRWGDLSTLGPQHMHPVTTPSFGVVQCVRKRMGKTGEVAFVPLPPLAQKLWEKYGRIPLPIGRQSGKPHLQEYNKLIKKAAQAAGLTRPVTVESFKAGRHEETQHPLHAVISSHTARHTAASRVREGADYETAQMVLGHASGGNATRYAHLDPVKTAERILNAWLYYEQKARS
jgi:integrase